MVRTIDVDVFLKQLGIGMSAPLVVLGSDQQRYILKNQKVDHNGQVVSWDCMFLNELISYQIAEYIGIPIPEAAIANLDRRLLEKGPSLRFVHRFNEGIHFASLEVEDTEENLLDNFSEMMKMDKPYIGRSWNSFFSNLSNPEDIARIIAFDLLIANFDRVNNTGNLLIAQEGSERKAYVIDHGHSFFGPKWETGRIAWLRESSNDPQYVDKYVNLFLGPAQKGWLQGMGEVFRALEQKYIFLDDCDAHSFQQAIFEIESISEAHLDKWFANVPDEWFVDKGNQIALYKHFILTQKNNLRLVLQEMARRKAFSNYRGGELQWKERRSGIV